MGAAALIQAMLDALTPAEREEREARYRRGEAHFTPEEIDLADAAQRRADSQRQMRIYQEMEEGRQRLNHEAEQRARAARLERYAAENGG
jgi:hypothetical protein